MEFISIYKKIKQYIKRETRKKYLIFKTCIKKLFYCRDFIANLKFFSFKMNQKTAINK
jgi:hypothetical protein